MCDLRSGADGHGIRCTWWAAACSGRRPRPSRVSVWWQRAQASRACAPRSAKRESFVVVELHALEADGRMAAVARRRTASRDELPLVGIAVTPGAGLREPGVAHAPALVNAAVAGRARGSGVRALEREASAAVVEGRRPPGVDLVARLASGPCDEAPELPAVRVGMAVGAAARREVQGGGRRAASAGGPAVASIAGDRQVAAAQREARLGMLGGAEARGPEARHVVAALAATAVTSSCQLTAVGVAMAVRAARVRDAQGTARLVACGAGERRVLAPERVGGLVVVEARRPRLAPAAGAMAARAVAAQPGAVHVLVARGTVLAGDGAEDALALGRLGRIRHALRVALVAGDRGVAPRERPARPRVVEARRRPPRALAVAGRAAAALELAPVLVLVAAAAVQGRAQEARRKSVPPFGGHVALGAGELRVLAHEPIPGLCVVEGLAPLLAPPHELGVDSLMLDVTGLAVAVLRVRVQALAGSDPPLQRLVTAQALRGGDTLPRVVTVEAVRAAFQLRVGAAQGTGRDLSLRRDRHARQPCGEEQRRREQPQGDPLQP